MPCAYTRYGRDYRQRSKLTTSLCRLLPRRYTGIWENLRRGWEDGEAERKAFRLSLPQGGVAMTLYIGICGNMKSGKSTLATLLAQRFGLPILSFAESLREEVSQAFFHKQQKREARFLWDLLEEQDKTLTRPLLQAWGQSRRALLNPDYWVERLQKYADRQGYDVAIIDDVRHSNEALHILNMGGMVIRLDANQQTLINRGASGFAHISEQLEPVDEILSRTKYAHQSVFFDTTGMTPLGMYRRLAPLVDDFLKTWGEEE